MIGERFVAPGLAHMAYAVACPETRRAAIVDPGRDLRPILAWLDRESLEAEVVLETHIHADYASGAPELAAHTGARLALSRYDEGEEFEASMPHDRLADGDVVEIGTVVLRVLHTPGHTPEHVSFAVTAAEGPVRLLTGDFLFIGSLGRPDLIGEEATADLARSAYASVRRLAEFADDTRVFPAHGAGSLCGAGMSDRLQSTLGEEREANPFLAPGLDEGAFVDLLLGRLPPFPPYYRLMKALNSAGAPAILARPPPPLLDPESASRAGVLVDLRPTARFAAGHPGGALSLPAGGAMALWGGWLVPYDTEIALVADEAAEAEAAAWTLAQVGLDRVVGWASPDEGAWQAAGLPWGRAEAWPPERVAATGSAVIADVRAPDEASAGEIPGAVPLYLGDLAAGKVAPPAADPLVLFCGTGSRSMMAVSVIERAGGTAVNLEGGLAAWRAAGLPVSG